MAAVATMPAKDLRMPEAAVPAAVPPPAPEPEPVVPPATGMAAIEAHPEWALLQRLPMRLTAAIPLPGFRVKDLLALKPGRMIASKWQSTDDVPFHVGSVQLSWCEFEVVEDRMAVRLTRLA
jgi:flagellar motor switch protein FliN/FliY